MDMHIHCIERTDHVGVKGGITCPLITHKETCFVGQDVPKEFHADGEALDQSNTTTSKRSQQYANVEACSAEVHPSQRMELQALPRPAIQHVHRRRRQGDSGMGRAINSTLGSGKSS